MWIGTRAKDIIQFLLQLTMENPHLLTIEELVQNPPMKNLELLMSRIGKMCANSQAYSMDTSLREEISLYRQEVEIQQLKFITGNRQPVDFDEHIRVPELVHQLRQEKETLTKELENLTRHHEASLKSLENDLTSLKDELATVQEEKDRVTEEMRRHMEARVDMTDPIDDQDLHRLSKRKLLDQCRHKNLEFLNKERECQQLRLKVEGMAASHIETQRHLANQKETHRKEMTAVVQGKAIEVSSQLMTTSARACP